MRGHPEISRFMRELNNQIKTTIADLETLCALLDKAMDEKPSIELEREYDSYVDEMERAQKSPLSFHAWQLKFKE